MAARRKILLRDLNEYLTCTLCGGYFIDATALIDCPHIFCRGCILRYFENCKQACPSCNVIYKKKQPCFRPDVQLQTLVYKLVPGLYSREMQRRDDFYRSTGVRASSSCSDDSVLGDMMHDHEQWVSSSFGSGDQFRPFYGPDDSISLSLEYYQHYLDDTDVSRRGAVSNGQTVTLNGGELTKLKNEEKMEVKKEVEEDVRERVGKVVTDRRYLQCPAAVATSHLQKFVRMKYGLTSDHRVDIIYEGEVLPSTFSLMDVAYTFNWKRTKPMRFFYRIFTPLKIRPIKIIKTSKQLQIVPVKPTPEEPPPLPKQQQPPPQQPKPKQQTIAENQDTNSQTYRNKEKLLAGLQLQSKSKAEEQKLKQMKQQEERIVRFLTPEPFERPEGRKRKSPENCVYEYEEPDKEEIKRFAEKRDREWALQKHLDEQEHHVRKRKKNKHSKNESVHKKRKLHAEITSLTKEESLKLKVKLTPHNGHKHKHHKGSEVSSSKEKLLEMRQVRHKPVGGDGKKGEEPVVVLQRSGEGLGGGKTLRSDFSVKTNASKELVGDEKSKVNVQQRLQQKQKQMKNDSQKTSAFERKMATLQQQCTIEAKGPVVEKEHKIQTEKKTNYTNEASKILNSPYHSGFTVCKVDSNKRKAEEDTKQDKRPSLEITLIPQTEGNNKPKRPPPATIPLDRIKKTYSFKSGISIIPKLPPEKCDNIGALDLTKPTTTTTTTTNQTNKLVNGDNKTQDKNHMSNLQMLSNVALDHLKTTKPKLPNLQTLKIPTPTTTTATKPPNLAKLPKLNEINKSAFRFQNAGIRTMRPNQNQNIRNIPNPSLLVRQQNQNRLNNAPAQAQQPTKAVEVKEGGKQSPIAAAPGDAPKEASGGDNKKSESSAVAAVTTEQKKIEVKVEEGGKNAEATPPTPVTVDSKSSTN